MKFFTLITGPLEVNTYILSDKAGECVVIDPADAKRTRELLDEQGLTCTHVLLTHCHFDHITGVAEMQRQGAKVCISAIDAPGLEDDNFNLSQGNMFRVEHCMADNLLHDGDILEAAGLKMLMIATPGHSQGSMCFLLESHRMLFSGDTLFSQSVGRCDFPSGSATDLFASIRQRLMTLEGDYAVYPGHGEETTLQREKKSNPYLRVDISQW